MAGLVTGRLVGWRATEFGASPAAAAPPPPALSVRAHADPVRALCFAAGGATLYSACAAGTLVALDTATGRLSGRLVGAAAAGAPVTRLAAAGPAPGSGPPTPGGPAPFPAGSFLAGDEDGGVVLWDPRSPVPALAVRGVHEAGCDVTALLAAPAHGAALSAGGDGVLALTDLRTGRVAARSDPDEDEVSCLALARGGRKVVSGSTGGVVGLWSWGYWGGCSDRWPLPRPGGCGGGGGRSSAAAASASSRPALEGLARLPGVLGLGDDALVAACGDGGLRLLGILPTGVAVTVPGAHGGGGAAGSARGVRPLEGVAVGNTAGPASGAAPPPIVATIAMACRELRAWDGSALARAAGAAGGMVSGAEAARRKRRAKGEEDSEDEDGEEGGGGARPAAKARGNFFADLL